MIVRRFSWCLIIVLLAIGKVEAQVSYQFVYAYQSQAGQFHIASIDPSTRQVILRTVEVDTIAGLSNAAAHPSTEWLAFLLRSGQSELLEVVNTRTLEVRTVVVDAYPPEAGDNLTDEPQDFTWSPDGQFIAFNVWNRESGANDTILYSMETGTTANLTGNASGSTQLAWSSDSTRLGVVSVHCAQSCTAALNIYEISTGRLMSSFPLTPVVVGAESPTLGGVCQLMWSPDNRYLSFMANCDSSDYGTRKEIYVLIPETSIIERITNYTVDQDIVAQNGFLFADYQTAWLNADTLLISAIYGLVDARRTETSLYVPSTGATITVGNVFFQAISVHAPSHRLAYQPLAVNPETHLYGSTAAPIVLAPTDGDAVGLLSSAPTRAAVVTNEGCLLDWSPDGSMIAYSLPSNLNNCESGTASFGIVQIGGEQSIDDAVYSLPSDALFVLPLGWIAR